MSKDFSRLVAPLDVLYLTLTLLYYVHSGCCQRHCSAFPRSRINTAFVKAGHVGGLHCRRQGLHHGLIWLSKWRRLLLASFKAWSLCCFGLTSSLSHDLFRLLCHCIRKQHRSLCWSKLCSSSQPGWSVIAVIIWPEKQLFGVNLAILKIFFFNGRRIPWWVHLHLRNKLPLEMLLASISKWVFVVVVVDDAQV